MLTIKCFSLVIPSLAKQLYYDFKSVQKIIDIDYAKTHFIVNFNMVLMLNLYIIMQSSDTNIFFVIFLYMINDQWIMFTLLSLSTKKIINPISDKRLQLFIKNVSIKMTCFKEVRLSDIKCKPWIRLSICHCIYLLKVFASFFWTNYLGCK